MAQSFFGINFGKRKQPQRSEKQGRLKTKKLVNIPVAEDILEFNYPPESRFSNLSSRETFQTVNE